MPEGDFRRPPQLWEQKIANLVAVNAVGSVSGGGTTEVGGDLPPGDGGPAPDPDPIAPTPVAFLPPSTPTVSGTVQGIRVTWDGNNNAGETYPPDAFVEVHVSTTSGFTPSSSTLRGRLIGPGMFTVFGLTAGTTYYARLVGVDAYGNTTTPSVQASSTTGLTTTGDYGTATIDAGAVSFNARTIGGITTTVGSTTPTSPVTGDIWLDSSSGAIIHKRWNGSAWVTQAWGSDSISAGAVTAVQVAAGAITAGAIAAGSITTAKLDASAVTADKIAASTITGDKIAANTITGNKIAAGTITATNIDVANLTVEKLTSGPFSTRRVVIGEVGSTDAVQFKKASTSDGWILAHNFSGEGLSLSRTHGGGTSGNFQIVAPVEGQSFRPESNTIVFQGYRTTTTAGDVVLRLDSNVTTTGQAKFQVEADGDVLSRTNSYAGYSDERLKENIQPARDYLDDLRQVEVVNFNWIGSDQKLLGVIAQQIQPIFPNMVAEDQDGTLSVRYSVFVPMLLTAVQSLADKVDDLTARIEALEGA